MDAADLLKLSPLDPPREMRLALAVRKGDESARKELARSSLRLVAMRAVSLGFEGSQLEEAIQDGTEGLMKAIDRFDPTREVSLATYAWPWITGAILAGQRRSADVPTDEFDDGAIDQVAMNRHESVGPESHLLNDTTVAVHQAIDQLGGYEATIVRQHFGLDGSRPMSRRAIGELLFVSESQVRIMESKAVQKLRQALARVIDRAP